MATPYFVEQQKTLQSIVKPQGILSFLNFTAFTIEMPVSMQAFYSITETGNYESKTYFFRWAVQAHSGVPPAQPRRSSVVSDKWYHDINPDTFYNWTSRLRKRGMVIPCSATTMEPAAAELQAAKSSSRNHETACRFILIVPDASPVSFPRSQYLLTTVLYSSEGKNFSLYLNAHLSKYAQ